MGGPGVQRSTRFVQYLHEFGYEPIVLTIKEEDIKLLGSSVDYSLMNFIPESTKIVRVSSAVPFKLSRLLVKLRIYRLFWFFLYPLFWERSALWPFKTFSDAEKIIRENGIELVYTSSGPFSSLILGNKLKSKLNIKWVADMRDPFTDAYAWSYPSKLHWRICRWFEKKFLSYADHLIVNTPEVKKLYINRGIKADKDISVITNGY